MRKLFSHTYAFFLTFPDRFYPFSCTVRGKQVRGMRSYEREVERALKRYGVGRLGYKLTLYREVFHLAGSILFIVLATWVGKVFLGSDLALYVLLYAAIIALTYQEFYYHPRRYKQHFGKGIADWVAWVIPMLIYLLRL